VANVLSVDPVNRGATLRPPSGGKVRAATESSARFARIAAGREGSRAEQSNSQWAHDLPNILQVAPERHTTLDNIATFFRPVRAEDQYIVFAFVSQPGTD
jgi:hypothetical protein